MLLGNPESAYGKELVVRVVWRGVTDGAAFSLENSAPRLSGGIEPVRIRRRLQRVQVRRQREKLFIAEPFLCLGSRQLRILFFTAWNESAEAREEFDALRQ